MLSMTDIDRRKLGRTERSLERSLDMAEGLTPVFLAMASPERPVSSKERMVLC